MFKRLTCVLSNFNLSECIPSHQLAVVIVIQHGCQHVELQQFSLCVEMEFIFMKWPQWLALLRVMKKKYQDIIVLIRHFNNVSI